MHIGGVTASPTG
jgi:putative transposase